MWPKRRVIEEIMKEKAFDKDIAFWQRMAPGYDRHVKWLGKSQDKVIDHLRERLRGMERVLDVGTGTGNIALELAYVVKEVVGVDPSPLMLQEARIKAEARNLKNVSFSEQDAYNLKFPDATFDAVIISHVLHIVDKPELALSEAKRVLKNGGLLIAPTYCHGLSRILSFIARNFLRQPVHFRFVPDDLVKLIGAIGFQILRCEILPDKIPVAFVEARST
jgi:ubiquinone/menaquinone biosynthesis C-methylase UbiE